ncbi:hypothetical protein L226DRAFT_525110 [Lentinus tigrinus ALCF2SS1-7]|uniref:uncharacterized protein n=1 Tax=Lentinus tigrinus ALCF2SS1-7 TaxID=1328758 RepID=UPI001165CF9B|nr:hypothetical protein L226DRAFT_525110 [Lentinus tigrinus ALCF2SS1-7]
MSWPDRERLVHVPRPPLNANVLPGDQASDALRLHERKAVLGVLRRAADQPVMEARFKRSNTLSALLASHKMRGDTGRTVSGITWTGRGEGRDGVVRLHGRTVEVDGGGSDLQMIDEPAAKVGRANSTHKGAMDHASRLDTNYGPGDNSIEAAKTHRGGNQFNDVDTWFKTLRTHYTDIFNVDFSESSHVPDFDAAEYVDPPSASVGAHGS